MCACFRGVCVFVRCVLCVVCVMQCARVDNYDRDKDDDDDDDGKNVAMRGGVMVRGGVGWIGVRGRGAGNTKVRDSVGWGTGMGWK